MFPYLVGERSNRSGLPVLAQRLQQTSSEIPRLSPRRGSSVAQRPLAYEGLELRRSVVVHQYAVVSALHRVCPILVVRHGEIGVVHEVVINH